MTITTQFNVTPQDRYNSLLTGDDTALTEQDTKKIDTARNVKQWYMVVVEDTPLMSRGDRIVAQFTPQQVQHNIGAHIVEAGGYGRESPIIQWVGGKLRDLTFQARLFSHHKEDNTAEEKLRELEYLCEVHPGKGRPPLVTFFWGLAIPDGMPCYVESLGGISYDEIRNDGSLRGVTLSITLKKWTQFRFVQTTGQRPDVSPGESGERTPVHIVKDGETYEMIAYRIYGDPMMGIPLRRLNPRSPMKTNFPDAVADLSAGDKIKLYKPQELMKEGFRPRCHVLDQTNVINADNRRRFFALRSTQVVALPRK